MNANNAKSYNKQEKNKYTLAANNMIVVSVNGTSVETEELP